MVDADPTEETSSEEPVRRRKLLAAAGATIVDATFGLARPSARQLDAFADALTRYTVRRMPAQPVLNLASLRTGVASAKRAYQACQYAAVAAELPALLIALQEAVANAHNDERLQQLHVLSADAYQVAASVLLKLDDHGLASLAADRSMRAAEPSEEPLALGASARSLVHTMMDGGHLRRDDEDRAATLALADEAEQAARRLGVDSNHYWTAFGPTNVLLHRVSFAATLGDAGSAIDYARRVDLSRVDVVERRAALYVDVARAFNQWGKYDKAISAIRQAEAIAPEEIPSRPAVHRLVADLAVRAPRSLRSEICQYADRIGAQA